MPLPRPFESVVYTVGTLATDCHVKSGRAFYSAPWRLMGQKMLVRTAGDIVQIFHDDVVVATHVWDVTGRSTNVEHYPPHNIAHTLRSVTWCRVQAEQTGPGPVAIVTELSQVTPSTDCGPSRESSVSGRSTATPPGRGLRPRARRWGSELSHRQGHPGRRHRARRRHTCPRSDTAGDPARPGGLRYRTHRLSIATISEHTLLQHLRA